MFGVFERMERNRNIRLIVALSQNMYISGLIKRINDMLLDPLVFCVWQRVELNRIGKYRLKIISDLRQGIRYYRKAPLLPDYVSVDDL